MLAHWRRSEVILRARRHVRAHCCIAVLASAYAPGPVCFQTTLRALLWTSRCRIAPCYRTSTSLLISTRITKIVCPSQTLIQLAECLVALLKCKRNSFFSGVLNEHGQTMTATQTTRSKAICTLEMPTRNHGSCHIEYKRKPVFFILNNTDEQY